jgi:uncharacterized protein (TIGR03437 family)
MGSPLRFFVIALIATTLATAGTAVQTIFGRNLISNPGAEDGEVSMPQYTGPVPVIPGWNRVGKTDVVPYGRFMDLSHMAPMNHLNNYFVGGWSNASSTISQEIDISAGAITIDGGGVTFDASAYLGGDFGKPDNAGMTVAFYDAGGHVLKTVTLGPVTVPAGLIGMMFQRRVGAVPKLARKVTVAVEFTRFSGVDNDGAADDLSLVLNAPTAADPVLNRNLLVNPAAESGPAAANGHEVAVEVPGWTRTTPFSVERYGAGGRIPSVMPGSPNRGAALFTAGEDSEVSFGVQDVDVSAAAAQIDSGSVRYSASAWMGGYAFRGASTSLTVEFRDWSDARLGSVPLGPVTPADRGGEARLVARSSEGVVPAGTRQIRVELRMTRATAGTPNDGCADDLSLVLSSSAVPAAPAISSVRSAQGFGGFSHIAPGTWIEITGYGLAPSTREWTTADFNGALAPQSLEGVRVTIGGQGAFLNYISPGQVNALVPANVGAGSASIVVNNGASNIGPYVVNVSTTMPGLLAPEAFRVNGQQHVAALFPDWTTYVLPGRASLGVPSRPAKPGDEIILLGIGFGGVTPSVPGGAVVSQANQLITPLEIRIGGVPAELKYAGLAPGNVGLYQFNVIVPELADSSAAPVTFQLGATAGSQTLFLAIQR